MIMIVWIYFFTLGEFNESKSNHSNMKDIKDIRIAVLIDADNIPSTNVKGMMEEIAKYGTPTFKRIYGDWTKPNVTGWKSVLLENAITPTSPNEDIDHAASDCWPHGMMLAGLRG